MELVESAGGLFAEAESCLDSMEVQSAIQFFDRAEEAGFEADACAAGRWTCQMLSGDYESAWRESDAINRRGQPDIYRFWNGQPLDGKHVLIRCLHGLGDTLQFIRYAPLIRQRARSLTIESQPVLKRLLRAANVSDRVITWGEPEPHWDQQIEVIELPRIFRTTVNSIPGAVPYLSAPSLTLPDCRKDALRVGLVWAASSFNPARCVPLAELAKLSDVPGVQFFSLQAGPAREQLQTSQSSIIDLSSEGDCLVPVARIVRSLDLIISVDTMMAHLAGAMGCPVWTLLPFRCDWRWMMHRSDSPWYPTMRLFRQPRPGAWQAVIDDVRAALQELAAGSLVNPIDRQHARLPLSKHQFAD